MLIVTCVLILKIDTRPTRRKQVVRTLERVISSGEREDQLTAAFHLFFGGAATNDVIPILSPLLKSVPADDTRRLWVAGAIFQGADPDGEHETLREEAMWLLFEALESNDPYSILVASIALQQEKVESPESCRALLRACEISADEFRIMIVGQLGRIGANQPEVIEKLLTLAGSAAEAEGVRLAAIQSLARVTERQSAIDHLLFQLLRDPNRSVIQQAAGVLQHRRGQLPDAAADILISLLDHPDANFRGMAALLLAEIPAARGRTIPILVEALGQEDDEEIAEALAVAIGQGGESAFPLVVDKIESAGLSLLPRYHYALLELARRNVPEAAELLLHHNPRVRQAVAWVLNSLGLGAVEAIPLLNAMLEREDSALVQDALIALRGFGVRGAERATNLGKLLTAHDAGVRMSAETILASLGPAAVPALQELRHPATEPEREAIDRCLTKLHGLHQTREVLLTGVEGVTDESDLELFSLVADLLQESGPLSFRTLSTLLTERQQAGTIREDLPCSDSKIRLVIRKLEENLSQATGDSVQLIDRSSTKKGGLTEEGKQYFRKAQDYLERLRSACSRRR